MNFIENIPFELPIVVTKGYVGFPKSSVNLTVERPISVNAVLVSNQKYESYCVLVCQKEIGEENIQSADDFFTVGVVAKLGNIETLNNAIRAKFVCYYRIQILSTRFENNTYYAKAMLYPDAMGDEHEEAALVTKIIENYHDGELSPLIKGSNADFNEQLTKGLSGEDFSYFIASRLGFDPLDKQDLLECANTNDRLLKIVRNIIHISKVKAVEEEINRKVNNSLEENQRTYILREKLKFIKKELGEDGEKSDETYLKKLEDNPYPEEMKNKVKDELKRKEIMPPGSLEASLIQDYLELVFNLPWFEQTQDVNDINNAKRVLDEDHYGLEKVKERILEYLAVKQFKGDLKAPILCFYGPPGCGKTSLSRSIARALGREFIKCSLGGVSDESEIRGHRRTYVGSRPGRIINLLKRAKVNNPVFLLDEIDKMTRNSLKGDPASALLEVLDPEQNTKFTDNYLEIDFDLSKVLFICTANSIDQIPEPLLDRLELIEVPSYTTFDKLHIAQDFLIKKESEANGVEQGVITFKDDAILYLIEHYTREAGVRNLERAIGKIIRKIIVDKLQGNKDRLEKVVVSTKDVKKYLGVEIFETSNNAKDKQIGVVTGLAYTSFGGDILPIEVNYFSGKGGLILTGKLGDVMKESCTIALDYVKANATKYNIDPDIFSKIDIHIHVPEGAVPKDGPSAGVAITCGIISALSKRPVSADYAMTGEVTLRGNAISIGGLREKSLAAVRSGIKNIIIPETNKANLEELPKEITNKLHVHYMKTVDDACELIFR